MSVNFKKLASYFWDIPIERTSSPQNAYLEVVWSNGKKMLNTKNANYSFGNGYKVFEYAFKNLAADLNKIRNVLVLGFGCGSIEHLIAKQNLDVELTGVEYDAEILRLHHTHFKATERSELHNTDALSFLQNNKEKYDMVIIDLFDDLATVPMVYEGAFTNHILNAVSPTAKLVYNTVKNPDHLPQRTELCMQLSKKFKQVKVHPFQEINEIIIAK